MRILKRHGGRMLLPLVAMLMFVAGVVTMSPTPAAAAGNCKGGLFTTDAYGGRALLAAQKSFGKFCGHDYNDQLGHSCSWVSKPTDGWQCSGDSAPVVPDPKAGLPDAVVSIGDSFISGEAARWKGNSSRIVGSRNQTDRAYRSGLTLPYDQDRVYTGGSCHRGDTAPIHAAFPSSSWPNDNALNPGSSPVPGVTAINLACSGATTANVHSSADRDGKTPPQTEQLEYVASRHNIKLVVLSIGGNDLGFSDLIKSCYLRGLGNQNDCTDSTQRKIDDRMAGTLANVELTINEVQKTLAAAGETDYRFVLQSYPTLLPKAGDFRSGINRLSNGCPFSDKLGQWSNQDFVPGFDKGLEEVALKGYNQPVEFLSLKEAFVGKELCHKDVRNVRNGEGNLPAEHEWVRMVAEIQGTLQESMHPNAYGQIAMGRCLRMLWNNTVNSIYNTFSCTNQGQGPQQMTLEGSVRF